MTAATVEPDGTILVRLTPEQEANAEAWGRAITHRRARVPGRFGDKSEERDIQAVRAKIALGLVFGRDYDGGTDRLERDGDVLPGVHARLTQPNGHLSIREDDPAGHIVFALVPGPSKTLRVVGYIRVANARRDAWRRRDWERRWKVRAAWGVPLDALIRLRPEIVDLPP